MECSPGGIPAKCIRDGGDVRRGGLLICVWRFSRMCVGIQCDVIRVLYEV